MRYSRLLAGMYDCPERYGDTEIMNNILESGAYILNSVHYYQKFKLKCELLHPLDLLLVADKIMKEKNRKLTIRTEMEPEIQGQGQGDGKKGDGEMIDEAS